MQDGFATLSKFCPLQSQEAQNFAPSIPGGSIKHGMEGGDVGGMDDDDDDGDSLSLAGQDYRKILDRPFSTSHEASKADRGSSPRGEPLVPGPS